MLPSRREHRFQKISVSAIYLHVGLKIPSQNDLLDGLMEFKTRPKRLKSAPRRSYTRFLAVSGGLLGGSWVNSASWKGLGMVLGPFWYHSEPIFHQFWITLRLMSDFFRRPRDEETTPTTRIYIGNRRGIQERGSAGPRRV